MYFAHYSEICVKLLNAVIKNTYAIMHVCKYMNMLLWCKKIRYNFTKVETHARNNNTINRNVVPYAGQEKNGIRCNQISDYQIGKSCPIVYVQKYIHIRIFMEKHTQQRV